LDQQAFSPWVAHRAWRDEWAGPRDREVIILFKKRMTEIWRETFQPRIDKEMEQFSADRPDASGEDKQLILVCSPLIFFLPVMVMPSKMGLFMCSGRTG